MGKLIFTYSTMKAGKTLDLIRVHYNYSNDTNVVVKVLKPTIDTRDHCVRSRNGSEIPVDINLAKTQNVLDALIENAETLPDVLLIDEAQFLTKQQVKDLHFIAIQQDMIIMCWGLRIDFQNNGFEGSMALLTCANDIREIKTVCSCGKKATHHLLYKNGKIVLRGDPVLIGDSEYTVVCSKCYYSRILEEEQ